MVLPKLTFLSWFVQVKANHSHKFTKWNFEDTKCKHGRPYGIWIPSFVLTTGNLGRGYGSWQAAEIQIILAHAGGVHLEHCRRDDTWLFVWCGPSICKWCDFCWMKLNASTIIDQDYDCLKVSHNASPATPINYWRNCTEGVWWPCYIGNDIWFQDDLWEASSLSFQSSFSKTWYLEEVLASIAW